MKVVIIRRAVTEQEFSCNKIIGVNNPAEPEIIFIIFLFKRRQ
jgi:hypothetical protein